MRPMLPSCTRSKKCRPAVGVFLGDAHHEAEVGLDEPVLGLLHGGAAALDLVRHGEDVLDLVLEDRLVALELLLARLVQPQQLPHPLHAHADGLLQLAPARRRR